MTILRTLGGLALGLAILVAAVVDLQSRASPWAATVRGAVAAGQAVSLRQTAGRRTAEVAVAFDGQGRIAGSRLNRSSGSAASDATDLGAARELASLHSPADVAGRTLLIRIGFRA